MKDHHCVGKNCITCATQIAKNDKGKKMTKEYKSLVLDAYITEKFLDKSLEEMVLLGYQLIPQTIRGNVLIFERDRYD